MDLSFICLVFVNDGILKILFVYGFLVAFGGIDSFVEFYDC